MSGIERNASFGETVDVLREWALAIRRDWGAIDGRSCKAQLDQLADRLARARAYGEAAVSLRRLREDAGLCPYGSGHWKDPQDCADYACAVPSRCEDTTGGDNDA